jgi:hypothetical protein
MLPSFDSLTAFPHVRQTRPSVRRRPAESATQGDDAMRKLLLAAGFASAVAAAGMLLPTGADAMTNGSVAGIGSTASGLDLRQTVQFVYRGHRHCWYPDGWQGPGWYWCGYRTRVGFGWGGPAGWQGWAYPGGPAVVVAPAAPVVVVKPRPRVRERVIVRP